MIRFFTNKFIIIIILIMMLMLSSFSNDYRTFDDYENEGFSGNTSLDHDDVNDSDIDETDEIDPYILASERGLNYTTIELTAPGLLPAGEPLYININISGNENGLDCLLTWYINDEPVKEERFVTGDESPGYTHTIRYSRLMDESLDIKASLEYTNILNEQHKIDAEKTIILENYDISHWKAIEAPRVLDMVTSRYNGDFTLEWALNNDYDVFDKELYINAKGYTSQTEYLIWVNRCFQRANVFIGTGNANEWELHEVFIISTGIWINSTPRGVTTIPSRTEEGWVFVDEYYRVEPVVRFWPAQSSPEGSSYAFHSRPLDIRTKEVIDERIGVPASSGCIRMYNDDAWWIFHNIPDHTTVVIY